MSSELAQFINSSDEDLGWSWAELNERLEESIGTRLRYAVITDTNLSLTRYESALKGMTFSIPDFSLTDILDDRLAVLFKLKLISMNERNVLNIRQNYAEHLVDFIVQSDTQEFIKLVAGGTVILTEDELINLLEDKRVQNSVAKHILDAYDGTLPFAHQEYSDTIKVQIIQAHFDPGDTAWVLQHYEQLSQSVREAFLSWSHSNYEHTMVAAREAAAIPIDIYAYCLDVFTANQAKELLQYLPDDAYESVCSGTRNPCFQDTAQNRRILDYLIEHDWISSYRITPTGLRAYSKRK